MIKRTRLSAVGQAQIKFLLAHNMSYSGIAGHPERRVSAITRIMMRDKKKQVCC